MEIDAISNSARFRFMKHRTPRYVYNRTRLILHERAHPEYPWITPGAVRLLGSLLRPTDRCVEFGSRRSTFWIAERVGHLTSVEHDVRWHAKVSNVITMRKLTNVDYILAPRDQPDELGNRSAYARTALAFADATIDFALIDGLYREHVTELMIPKIKSGGILVIDNANWYLPAATHAPSSRSVAIGANGPIWTRIATELVAWRSIWTSSGVTDTAIYIRP